MKAGIIDYGMGNIFSVIKAFEYTGCKTFLAEDEKSLKKADILILPGVGSFFAAYRRIKKMRDFIGFWIDSGKPFIGICLGYQLLFEKSQEGNSEGFKILKGSVKKLPAKILPHIGWNKVYYNGVEEYFYFVHSYAPFPESVFKIEGITEYGCRFTSLIWHENMLLTQFHPERSGIAGLNLIKKFLWSLR